MQQTEPLIIVADVTEANKMLKKHHYLMPYLQSNKVGQAGFEMDVSIFEMLRLTSPWEETMVKQ